jgi:hypothetical protein
MDKRLYPRLLKAWESSFFLFGMRGVGKSTWANLEQEALLIGALKQAGCD